MKYSLPLLKEEIHKGKLFEYFYFWGHKIHTPLTETCFSQWYPAPFVHEGLTYPTAEHWMMAGKARTFDDAEILQRMFETGSPAEAKKLGREIKNFDPDTWDKVKYELVKEGNVLKFSQHADMKAYLLQTGSKVIVEASPMDAIWGIGLGRENPKAKNPFTWRGENLLGFALMEVRDEMR
ncbi:MAG: NADAR family protein [Bacteroidetes bacterium]|nr:NADAR family protein [Bacteroidota bacterium]